MKKRSRKDPPELEQLGRINNRLGIGLMSSFDGAQTAVLGFFGVTDVHAAALAFCMVPLRSWAKTPFGN